MAEPEKLTTMDKKKKKRFTVAKITTEPIDGNENPILIDRGYLNSIRGYTYRMDADQVAQTVNDFLQSRRYKNRPQTLLITKI